MTWATGIIFVILLPLIILAVIAEWASSRDRNWIRRVDGISKGRAHQTSEQGPYPWVKP